jgi:hypothetical protein
MSSDKSTTDLAPDEASMGLDLIWGIKPIGEAIGRNPRQTYHLCANGKLPARLVGGRWVSSRSALREYFTARIGEVG